jgi:hypothetical protein
VPANFLEELVAEWYQYRGYFIRRNVLVGKRGTGGFECELDVVAFHPSAQHLVHIEPSTDAASWAVRERRFHKKFSAGRKHIPALFRGLTIPRQIEQIALLVFASTKNRRSIGGGDVLLVRDLLAQIFSELQATSIYRRMVPEEYTILRAFQFAHEYRRTLFADQRTAG